MQKATEIIGTFLKATGDASGPKLGAAPRRITKDQVEDLKRRLDTASGANGAIARLLVILYTVILMGALIIAFIWINEPKQMRLALGGSFLSLLGIMKGLHAVWREKSAIDLISAMLPCLSPEDCMKLVEAYFYAPKRR